MKMKFQILEIQHISHLEVQTLLVEKRDQLLKIKRTEKVTKRRENQGNSKLYF